MGAAGERAIGGMAARLRTEIGKREVRKYGAEVDQPRLAASTKDAWVRKDRYERAGTEGRLREHAESPEDVGSESRA